MAMWGISGWYLGDAGAAHESGEAHLGSRSALRRASRVTSRWVAPAAALRPVARSVWGPWLKAAWAFVGVVPAVMFVTGVVMWWNRVVRRRRSPATVVEPTWSGVPVTVRRSSACHRLASELVLAVLIAMVSSVAIDARAQETLSRGEESSMHVPAERRRRMGKRRRARRGSPASRRSCSGSKPSTPDTGRGKLRNGYHDRRRDRSARRGISAPDAGVPDRAPLHDDGLRRREPLSEVQGRPLTARIPRGTRDRGHVEPGAVLRGVRESSAECVPSVTDHGSSNFSMTSLPRRMFRLILRSVRRQAQVFAELPGRTWYLASRRNNSPRLKRAL